MFLSPSNLRLFSITLFFPFPYLSDLEIPPVYTWPFSVCWDGYYESAASLSDCLMVSPVYQDLPESPEMLRSLFPPAPVFGHYVNIATLLR